MTGVPVRIGIIGLGEIGEIHTWVIQGDPTGVNDWLHMYGIPRKENNISAGNGLVKTEWKFAKRLLGRRGRQFARRLLRREQHVKKGTPIPGMEGVKIVAVSDVDEERLARYCRTFNVRDAYTNYKELLARKDVDAVLVCTPPSLHAEITVEAARHGKHIFCEKPMAMTSEECTSMINATKEAGVVLQIGYVLRFSNERGRIRDAILNGEIGRPVFWRETYNAWAGGPRWVHDHYLGGGPLWENSHSLDFLRSVFGEPELVFGIGGRYKPNKTTALDTIAVLLSFPTGDKALFTDSYALSGFGWDEWVDRTCRRNFLQIDVFGPKGFIQYPDVDLSQKLMICTYGEHEHEFARIPWSSQTGADGYRQELEHFFECAREGKPSLVPGEEGLLSVKLVETVFDSMQTGTVCNVASQCEPC